MLKFLRNYCAEKGIKKIYASSCDYQSAVHTFEKLGFKKDESAEIIYDKCAVKCCPIL